MTLVVNLFAGPGTGKSTMASKIFADLKTRGIEAELAHEYAKDLTWEERHRAIRYAPYVAAKQIWRVHRLLGQVDIVVTDSPILLSCIYQGEGYTQAFEDYILDTFNSWNHLNIFLKRHIAKKYSEKGRNQTKEEALDIDERIKCFLIDRGIEYEVFDGPPISHRSIVKRILECI